MMRPQPAAARRRGYSMMFAVTKPSDGAWPDHIGGITMRLRRVRPGRDNGERRSATTPPWAGNRTEQRTADSRQLPALSKTGYLPVFFLGLAIFFAAPSRGLHLAIATSV